MESLTDETARWAFDGMLTVFTASSPRCLRNEALAAHTPSMTPVPRHLALAETPVPALNNGRLALFDVDRTLIPGSCLIPLARRLRKSGLLDGAVVLGALVRNGVFQRRGSSDRSVDALRQHLTSLVGGVEYRSIEPVVEAALDDIAELVYPGARLLIQRHLDAADFCVLVSAAPQPVVEGLAARLGVQRGIGTVPEIVDGRLTGGIVGTFCYGAGKLSRLEEVLGSCDLSNAMAYADSMSDLPVLRAVGRPVAVSPDRRLDSLARDQGWPILRFD